MRGGTRQNAAALDILLLCGHICIAVMPHLYETTQRLSWHHGRAQDQTPLSPFRAGGKRSEREQRPRAHFFSFLPTSRADTLTSTNSSLPDLTCANFSLLYEEHLLNSSTVAFVLPLN